MILTQNLFIGKQWNMQNLVHTLDLHDFLSNQNRRAFVNNLETSLRTTGFFFLKNHLIDPNLLDTARRLFTEFFDTPEEFRMGYTFPKEFYQRGYTPLRTEAGEFAQKTPDEKHFFQVGNRTTRVFGIKGFNSMTSRLFLQFNQNYLLLLQAIAESLDMPTDYFDKKAGNSIFRAIDYPPMENPLVDDEAATKGGNITGMCATKHTDINMLTLLEAREPGLQLWHDLQWIPVTITEPNVIVVNCGDMLEHLTNGIYRSGLHRVVCERNTRRFSIPFFGHIHEHESLVPLQHLGQPNRLKFPYKTAGAFLHHRLKQIGLIK